MSNYYVTFNAEIRDLSERLAALGDTTVSLGQRWEEAVQVSFNAEGDFDFLPRNRGLMEKLEIALKRIGACAFVLFVDGHEFGFLCTVYPTRWSIWCDSPYQIETFMDQVATILHALNLVPTGISVKAE